MVLNWGGGFEPTLQLSGIWPVGLGDGDGDGDGDTDLLVSDFGDREVTLWINDGYDFAHSDTFVLDSKVIPYLTTGQPLGEAASLLWYQPQGPWQLTRPWAGTQEPPRSFEAEVNPYALHLLADLDGNGMVDLLSSPKRLTMSYGKDYHGLALWRLDASAGWHAIPCSTGRRS